MFRTHSEKLLLQVVSHSLTQAGRKRAPQPRTRDRAHHAPASASARNGVGGNASVTRTGFMPARPAAFNQSAIMAAILGEGLRFHFAASSVAERVRDPSRRAIPIPATRHQEQSNEWQRSKPSRWRVVVSWCVEAVFEQVRGVIDVQSGYSNGHAIAPSYEQVCSGDTGHAEVVRVRFDPENDCRWH